MVLGKRRANEDVTDLPVVDEDEDEEPEDERPPAELVSASGEEDRS
jgi:hypothetical protein